MCFDQIVCPLSLRIRPFAYLQKQYSQPRSSFYGYLQIHHIASSFTRDLVLGCPSAFKRICKMGPSAKGPISQIHKLLVALLEDPFPKHLYVLKWERVFGWTLSLSTLAAYLDMRPQELETHDLQKRIPTKSSCIGITPQNYYTLCFQIPVVAVGAVALL